MDAAQTPRELVHQLTRARRLAALAVYRNDMAGCVLAESRARRIAREIAQASR